MPKFLSQDEVYRVLQRELPPDDVYPDGAPSAFFSTADMYSVAKTIGDAYQSASACYIGYFPTLAPDTTDLEYTYFGYTLDGSLSVDERRSRLLAQIRKQRRTTSQDLLNVVYTIVDASVVVELVEWSDGDAGWMLDVSQLEISSILNEFNGVEVMGVDGCNIGNPANYGLTADQWARLQQQAYTYEIRVYGYTLTAAQRAAIDSALNSAEPARSQHIIVDGLNPSDTIGGTG